MLLFCCLLCFPVRKAFEFLFNDFHDLIWNYLQKITLRAIFSNLPVWSSSITTVWLVFSPVFLSCICPVFLVFRQNLIYSCLFALWSQTDFFTTEFSRHYNGRVCAPHSCLFVPWGCGASAASCLNHSCFAVANINRLFTCRFSSLLFPCVLSLDVQ